MEAPTNLDGPGFQTKPGVSRFAGPVLQLEFSDGSLLAAHRSVVVEGCPWLARFLSGCPSSVTRVKFDKHSPAAGHALVSYLYTGRYDLPKWTGPVDPSVDLELLDLKTQFEIYAFARAVELGKFEEQARSTIEWLASKQNLFAVIDAVKLAYPTPVGDDSWFEPWITSIIKSALRSPQTLVPKMTQGSPNLDDDASVLKMIFKCMLKTYMEMAESLPDPDGADLADLDTPAGDTSSETSELFVDNPTRPKLSWPVFPLRPALQAPADAKDSTPDANLAERSWTAAFMLAPPASCIPAVEMGPELGPVQPTSIPGVSIVDPSEVVRNLVATKKKKKSRCVL